MMYMLMGYGISLLSLMVIDGVWLGLVMRPFYVQHLGHLFGPSVRIVPAVLFYLLYAVGVSVLVVRPHFSSSWVCVALHGALLGAVAYGAYDFTNHATLRDWPTIVTVVDIAWGMVATALVSVISQFTLRYFGF